MPEIFIFLLSGILIKFCKKYLENESAEEIPFVEK